MDSVVDVTHLVWKLVDSLLYMPPGELAKSFPLKSNETFAFQVHECVLDGPQFDAYKVLSAPHMYFYFDDFISLLEWLCLQTTPQFQDLVERAAIHYVNIKATLEIKKELEEEDMFADFSSLHVK
jgi:hypothetical protein